MILDSGIAEFARKVNVAPKGGKPEYDYQPYYTAYYGELNFETSPAWPTESREEVRTDARIRVLQDRRINNHDRVTLTRDDTETVFEVTRAYHGADDESGERITDVNLEAVSP